MNFQSRVEKLEEAAGNSPENLVVFVRGVESDGTVTACTAYIIGLDTEVIWNPGAESLTDFENRINKQEENERCKAQL